MKAVVLVEPEHIEILDIPHPIMTEKDHIIIEVKACGVCGSDVRYYYGENPWALHTLGYNAPSPPNIVLGHEYSGIVREVNSNKNKHLIGKRVVIQPWKGCGTCKFCIAGKEHLCVDTIHTGHGQGWGEMDFYPGAMAEYCLAWGTHIYEIPDKTSFEAAAMNDILGVAVHTVNRAPLYRGAEVLCIGGGPAGIYSALIAIHKGAKQVYILEKSALARKIIEKYNQCVVIDNTKASLKSLLKGKENSFAAIYDSVGDPELFREVSPYLEEMGTYVNMAVQDIPLTLNNHLLSGERTITTASNALYSENKEAIKTIIEGRFDVTGIITHYTTFDTFMDDFNLLLKDPKEAFKVVLRV